MYTATRRLTVGFNLETAEEAGLQRGYLYQDCSYPMERYWTESYFVFLYLEMYTNTNAHLLTVMNSID